MNKASALPLCVNAELTNAHMILPIEVPAWSALAQNNAPSSDLPPITGGFKTRILSFMTEFSDLVLQTH